MNLKMKLILSLTVFTLFILLPFYSPIEAQRAETLIDGSVRHGGFGGPMISVGDVAGSPGLWVGGRGGWIINIDDANAISLGGGGYGLVTNHKVPITVNDQDDLYALNGYGGFVFEYTNRSYRLTHFTVSTLIGGGGLMLRERNYEEVSDDVDSYFVFEPGFNLELNVTTFFRVAAGIQYRFTSGISEYGFSDSDFSGPNGVLTFKFGGF